MGKTTTARRADTPALQHYTFWTTREYFQTLKTRIEAAGAGDRIVLVTLRLKAEEPVIQDLIASLCAASQRGAAITVLVDAYHILVKDGAGEVPGLTLPRKPTSKRLPKFLRRRQDALEELRQAGVRCEVLNRPSKVMTSPFRGRSHIKFTIFNDEVFIGGCNLDDPAYLDVMVSWHDRHIADWLSALAESFADAGRVSTSLGGKDLEIPIDSHTSLLIDAGTTDQSVIMDRAFDIIDSARKRLLITYQFFPHGPVLERLSRAVNKGVKLRAFYNHPMQHKYPYSLLYGALSWQMRRTSAAEFSVDRLPRQHAYLHAKVLTSEQTALISSHNYMITGVQLGTAEIGLVSTDAAFVRQLEKTLLQQLNTTNNA